MALIPKAAFGHEIVAFARTDGKLLSFMGRAL